MKNSNFFLIIFLFINIHALTSTSAISKELFNFKIKEIEITQNGNLFKGFNGGEVTSNDGVLINAEYFEYNKFDSLLLSQGNVKLNDTKKKIILNAGQIVYLKNLEKITATNNVKIRDLKKNIIISANKIFYLRNKNEFYAYGNVKIQDTLKKVHIKADELSYKQKKQKIEANGNVKLIDEENNLIITTENISYIKENENIFTSGSTEIKIDSKYTFSSSDVKYDKIEMLLMSNKKSKITDEVNLTQYKLNKFSYDLEKELLKGTQIFITENSSVPIDQTNKLYFSDGFFDFKNENFKTGLTKIKLRNDIFGKSENNPRLKGVSSSMKDGVTTVKKAIFTSCKEREKCPPWVIQASEIKHDKKKKQMIYKDALLKLYDVPIFYFPKFFHPDLTVKRQSGFLLPRFNNSNILGSSVSVPYFYAIAENKDMTFTPTLFYKNSQMIQTEFRQKNENSFLTSDIGISHDFKSSETNKKKNAYHFFSKYNKNLNFDNFNESNFNFFIEKVNKDTYLKIFDNTLASDSIKPKNLDLLNSGFDFLLDNENYYLSGGANIFEDLTKNQNDRYQYVFPYYNFSKNIKSFNFGFLDLTSKGNNNLKETNKVTTQIINDLSFKSNDKIFEKIGLKNNLNLYFKNLNNLGKNIPEYKTSPQIELQSLVEFNSELPLLKFSKDYKETLIPKISLKFNPTDMRDNSAKSRKINIENIFDSNRLSIDESLESGKSITIGTSYKKESNTDKNKFIEYKLASVFRDRHEQDIPSMTSLHKRNSNLFGSIDYGLSNNLIIDYKFALDNKIENFVFNSIGIDFSLNNFVTTFNYIEEELDSGNTNILENTTKYNLNNNNSISFKTRKNREIDLTEYYDLVYEYKNDCLTAGIKFNKTYYEDRDLKPSENIMFTISFYPLTSVEQSIK